MVRQERPEDRRRVRRTGTCSSRTTRPSTRSRSSRSSPTTSSAPTARRSGGSTRRALLPALAGDRQAEARELLSGPSPARSSRRCRARMQAVRGRLARLLRDGRDRELSLDEVPRERRRRGFAGLRRRAAARRLPDPRATVRGRPLVYLDNAATTQKPRAVIDADDAATTPRQRQHPPRRPPALASGRRPRSRGRAAKVAALPRRRAPTRDHLRPRHDRGDQPRGASLGRREPRARATRS